MNYIDRAGTLPVPFNTQTHTPDRLLDPAGAVQRGPDAQVVSLRVALAALSVSALPRRRRR